MAIDCIHRRVREQAGACTARLCFAVLFGALNFYAPGCEAGTKPASDALPIVASIRFEGNRVTQERTLARELALVVGAPADPEAIERSRQAILDLGLFREVEARAESNSDGEIDVVFRVRERRYLLIVPRIDAGSDANRSYGAQVRWNNAFGLNHSVNAIVERGEYPEEVRRSDEDSLRFSYAAPFVFDTPFTTGFRLERLERVRPALPQAFVETFDRAEFLLARDMTEGRPRRGWEAGGGLFFERQRTEGENAPAADGRTSAFVGTASFRDLRDFVYSENGTAFDLRAEMAVDGLASDFSYTRFDARYVRSDAIGAIDHQNLIWRANLGWIGGGRNSRNEYGLGGSGRLRGYPADFAQGNRYAYGTVEYTRPIARNWLRGFVAFEVGGAQDDFDGSGRNGALASIGIGVRVRLTWFVDVELEAGIAQPLRGGDGARFFAGGN